MLKRIQTSEVFPALLSTFLIAIQFPLIGIGMKYITSAQGAVMEAFFTSIYCYIASRIQKNPTFIIKERIMIISGFLNALGLIFLFEALARLHPGVVGLVGRLYFVYAMIIAFTYFAEKPDRWDILNVIVAVLGVFLISLPKDVITQKDIIGITTAVLYPACFAIQNAIVKAAPSRMDSTNMLFNTKFYAIIPLSFYLLYQSNPTTPETPWKGILIVAFSALVASYFGLAMFYKVMKTVSFSVAHLMKVTEPLFVLILSALIFPVKLELSNIAGILLILMSVAITILKPKKV
jgi:drug/metabolite transporter (DMT)-like permease